MTHKNSWQTRITVAALSIISLGQILWGTDWVSRRAEKKFTKCPHKPLPPAAPAKRFHRGLRVVRDDGEWPVWILEPKSADSRTTVVYVHGGAYVGQIGGLQWGWVTDVARRADVRVVVPIYPLAPWGTAATAVPEVADIIAREIASGERVTVVGDSAGGGLALAATQELVRRGAELPAGLTLLSPWLDVTISDPRSYAVSDPLLAIPGLRAAGKLWAGTLLPTDALVSPLFDSLDGIPPTFVVAGDRDVLYPDSARLADRAIAEGAPVRVHIQKGLVHTWSLMRFLPETKALWPQVRAAIRGAVG